MAPHRLYEALVIVKLTYMRVIPGKAVDRYAVSFLPEKGEARLDQREGDVAPVKSTHFPVSAAKRQPSSCK